MSCTLFLLCCTRFLSIHYNKNIFQKVHSKNHFRNRQIGIFQWNNHHQSNQKNKNILNPCKDHFHYMNLNKTMKVFGLTHQTYTILIGRWEGQGTIGRDSNDGLQWTHIVHLWKWTDRLKHKLKEIPRKNMLTDRVKKIVIWNFWNCFFSTNQSHLTIWLFHLEFYGNCFVFWYREHDWIIASTNESRPSRLLQKHLVS